MKCTPPPVLICVTLLTLAALVAPAPPAWAQDLVPLTGRVVAKDDGRPLPRSRRDRRVEPRHGG